jgi:hypothetical protein
MAGPGATVEVWMDLHALFWNLASVGAITAIALRIDTVIKQRRENARRVLRPDNGTTRCYRLPDQKGSEVR